jgi:Tfp pilus assembly protein PilF
MRRPIQFAEPSRRNYLPLALTALALVTIFACDRREEEQATTTPTDEPVVVSESKVESPAPASTPTYENVTYEEAESAFTSRRYSEATEMFASYVARRPGNPWGHYMLGLSAWKSGQLPRARESFERAIELDPSHVKSLLNLSRVLLELKETREASERVLAALQLDSTSADAHRLMGRVQTALGDTDAALASYRTAVVLDAHDVWAMNNMGLLLIELERFEEALRPLARAVQLDSSIAVFRNNFGMALERTGHFVAAAESYRVAVAIDPGYAKASASLARIDGRVDDLFAPPIDVALLADDFVREIETWKGERVAVSEDPAVVVVPDEPTPPKR